MATNRRYIHDRFVLFFLAVNAFLTLAVIVTIALKLGDTGEGYIQQYRSNLGLNGYRSGGVGEILSFMVFAVIVFVFQIVFSYKIYDIKKQAAWAIVVLSSLLLILALLISGALLELR